MEVSEFQHFLCAGLARSQLTLLGTQVSSLQGRDQDGNHQHGWMKGGKVLA